jgi:hypothetical protein
MWIVHTMRDFGVITERISLMCDNTSAISVAKNTVLHKRIRHLERRHHFLRDHVEKGDIEMRYIDTESVGISYAAPQAHEIVNVALHREYSLGIVFIFSKGMKDLYHI